MTTVNPIRIFEVYYHETNLMGYEMTWESAYQVQKKYPVKFDLRGKAAHFLIVSNDLGVTRHDAIAFCDAVHSGRMRFKNIDLGGL